MEKQELIELCKKASKLHEEGWKIGASIIEYFENDIEKSEFDNFESDVWLATEHGEIKCLIEDLKNLDLLCEKRVLYCDDLKSKKEYSLKEAKQYAVKELSKLILDDEFEDNSFMDWAANILDIARVLNFADLNNIVWDDLKWEFVNPKKENRYTLESMNSKTVHIAITLKEAKDEMIRDIFDLAKGLPVSIQKNFIRLGNRIDGCLTEKELFEIINEYSANWKIKKLD